MDKTSSFPVSPLSFSSSSSVSTCQMADGANCCTSEVTLEMPSLRSSLSTTSLCVEATLHAYQVLEKLGDDDFHRVESHERDEKLQGAASNRGVFFTQTSQHERTVSRHDGVIDVRHLDQKHASIRLGGTEKATQNGCLDCCSGGTC